MKTIVIGAGLAGLMIARGLAERGDEVWIYEKSRGVGGRIATRRSEKARFDHGAQFYKLREPLADLHRRWSERGLVEPWFKEEGVGTFRAVGGMTALAKDLAAEVDVRPERRVIRLNASVSGGWDCEFDSANAPAHADRVVLTAPLPQALELLRASQIPYDPTLEAVTYAKAIVALIELEKEPALLAGGRGYREVADGFVFSIADQMIKRVSVTPALTVTLDPRASESNYDLPEEELARQVLDHLVTLEPGLTALSTQIKKWRYAQPVRRAKDLYASPAPSLYLAGDGFGGPSLNGAAASANAVLEHLAAANARSRH